MKLDQKRKIVARFRAGESFFMLARELSGRARGKFLVDFGTEDTVEPVIRDFMNGKFQLKPKRKGKR